MLVRGYISHVDPPFVIITMYLLCLIYTVMYLGVEKKNFKDIMHFHNMIFMAMPKHKNPAPGVMKLTILVNASNMYVIIII